MTTKIIPAKQARLDGVRQQVLEIAEEAFIDYTKVNSNESGDKYFQWKTDYIWGNRVIFTDYWHIKPSKERAKITLYHCLRDGELGKQLTEEIIKREDELAEKYTIGE